MNCSSNVHRLEKDLKSKYVVVFTLDRIQFFSKPECLKPVPGHNVKIGGIRVSCSSEDKA